MKIFLTSETTPKNARHQQSNVAPTAKKTRTLPYGFKFGGDGNWVLDAETSEVVKRIFDFAGQGIFESDIAAKLKAEQIPTPSEYKKLRNDAKFSPNCAWRTKGVRDILRDLQYTGAYVGGRFEKKADGSGLHYRTHESDWIIETGKYPAIISKAEFDAVADIMANRGKCKLAPRDYLLRGNIVKCGCCGYAMSYDNISDPVYRCYHTIADASAKCHKLKISAAKLDKAVLTVIRKRAELVLKTADLSKLRRKSVDERKISDVENEIAQNALERQQQYERFVLGEITRDEYAELKADCAKRLERLTKQLAAMKSEIDASKVDPRAIAVAKSALSESDNNRELVEALIKTVKVYPNNRVDIDWKIAGFGSAE